MNRIAAFSRSLIMVPLCFIALSSDAAAAEKDQGRELFQSRCAGCHSVDTDKVGPRLRGVFGRAAGAVPGFRYSTALAKAHVTWDEATLEKWLADPESVVPDNDMSFRLDNGQERAAIIAYLKQLAAK